MTHPTLDFRASPVYATRKLLQDANFLSSASDCFRDHGLVGFEQIGNVRINMLGGFEMTIRDEFVLVKEAAELLGVCPNTIRSWGDGGKLTEYRHPVNNYRLYKRSELEKVLRKVERSARKTAKS